MKYPLIVAGEWVQPAVRKFKMGCCDCGLVHAIDFRVVKGHVQMRMFRDNRATAAVRRNGKFNSICDIK